MGFVFLGHLYLLSNYMN